MFLFLKIWIIKKNVCLRIHCVCMCEPTCVRGIDGAAKTRGEFEIWSLFKSERTAAF